MSRIILICLFVAGSLLFAASSFAQEDFRTEQKKYRRVRTAYSDKETIMKQLLEEKGIDSFHIELFIRAFKSEKTLEVWVRQKKTSKFVLFVSYPFSGYSGELGPKYKQGDGQIPEGFYHVDRFNPASNFYLSLGLNYPNRVDRKRAGSHDPGGDIFIHGNRVTIGCIPITNNKIKELYLLAVEARTHGQIRIPVHIFPFRFHENWIQKVSTSHRNNQELISFWKILAQAYRLFEENNLVPLITISDDGSYQVVSQAE